LESLLSVSINRIESSVLLKGRKEELRVSVIRRESKQIFMWQGRRKKERKIELTRVFQSNEKASDKGKEIECTHRRVSGSVVLLLEVKREGERQLGNEIGASSRGEGETGEACQTLELSAGEPTAIEIKRRSFRRKVGATVTGASTHFALKRTLA